MDIYGESEGHVVDDRSRICVPNRFKSFFEVGGYLMRDFSGNCLVFHPASRMEAVKAQITDLKQQLSSTDPTHFIQAQQASELLSRYVGIMQPVMMDAQGRIALPSGLRRRAGINNTVVFLALGDRLEIWDQEKWQQYEDTSLNPEFMAQTLSVVAPSKRGESE